MKGTVSLTSTKAVARSATSTIQAAKKSGKAPSSKKARGSIVGVASGRSVQGLDARFSDYVGVVEWVKHDKDEVC